MADLVEMEGDPHFSPQILRHFQLHINPAGQPGSTGLDACKSAFCPLNWSLGLVGQCSPQGAATLMHDDESRRNDNEQIFRDCIFSAIVEKSSEPATTKKSTARARRKSHLVRDDKQSARSAPFTATNTAAITPSDPDELADFAAYLATEIFTSLPTTLQLLSHITIKSPDAEPYTLPLTLTTLEHLIHPLPPSITDTLTTYTLINPPHSDTATFLSPILTSYITATSAPPPPPSSTRTSSCQLCDRDWVPLTYHHLIPRSTHARALKRGWHREEDLQSVAWLCRACHSAVHRMVGNEELAREFFTVERLREREDVGRWVGWVSGVRWKKR